MEGLAEGEELASNILHLRRGSGACTAAAAPGHVPGPITATTTGAGLCWCATAAAPYCCASAKMNRQSRACSA